uniref:Uncharacterized protein n=1 Tax=Amphimedon queenslandica TaxID=400682 RepID=A0A1X7TEE2_AMPQE
VNIVYCKKAKISSDKNEKNIHLYTNSITSYYITMTKHYTTIRISIHELISIVNHKHQLEGKEITSYSNAIIIIINNSNNNNCNNNSSNNNHNNNNNNTRNNCNQNALENNNRNQYQNNISIYNTPPLLS